MRAVGRSERVVDEQVGVGGQLLPRRPTDTRDFATSKAGQREKPRTRKKKEISGKRGSSNTGNACCRSTIGRTCPGGSSHTTKRATPTRTHPFECVDGYRTHRALTRPSAPAKLGRVRLPSSNRYGLCGTWLVKVFVSCAYAHRCASQTNRGLPLLCRYNTFLANSASFLVSSL